MAPSTPSSIDLSRPRLKALSKWVRDELDLRVAREGPDILRPDDVLLLHETFIALRHATDITSLDLRATGIHHAVRDIAGVATRWPGRLCDDCDTIISLWTEEFGPLDQLRPFLYGRGGRLEGIASFTEYSREALLKRWSIHCPENIHPKKAHRLGDLGFKPGDWWINTLFAHHAGIIGLEAVEGGTTFDKHGAYALVLKNTGEVEAGQEDKFTYRVPQWDKGKFRLTAATSRSRDPIRVLRSHSINSVWGPKAGVRYEGLYGVRGWSISQAKSTDDVGGQWKKGDIIFEVKFQRQDSIPMEEVCLRPTATEVDDYAEYKRLRKQHRERKRKTIGLTIDNDIGQQLLARVAPPIAPPTLPPTIPSVSSPTKPTTILRLPSETATQRNLFRHPRFDLHEETHHEHLDVVSPGNVGAKQPFWSQQSSLTVPQHVNRRSDVEGGNDQSSISQGSMTSTITTATNPPTDITEVAPWIDFDIDLTLPSSSQIPAVTSAESVSPSIETSASRKTKKKKKNPVSDDNMESPAHSQDSPPISTVRKRRKSSNFKHMTDYLNLGGFTLKPSKSAVMRSRNPMSKLFDGTTSLEDNDRLDSFIDPSSPLPYYITPPHQRYKHHASSSDGTARVLSPIPIRPFSPDFSFPASRHGIYTSEDEGPSTLPHTDVIALPTDDPFIQSPPPVWLTGLLSLPRAATASPTLPEGVYVEIDEVDPEEGLWMARENWDEKMGFGDSWLTREGRERRDSGRA